MARGKLERGASENEIRRQVDLAFKRLSERFGITASGRVKHLICEIIQSIVLDPSPDWNVRGRPELESVQRTFIQNLPDMLENMVIEDSPNTVFRQYRKIETFALLHSISSILDRICPFEKPNPNKPRSQL